MLSRLFAPVGGLILCVPLLCAAESYPPDHARIQAFERGLVARTSRSDADASRYTIEERLAHHGVPAVAVAILEDGQVVWARGYGTKLAGEDMPVDADTVFSVGSVSKVVNAALVLRLQAQGKVDVDTDVNDHLSSWQVKESRHTRRQPVTLRAILSHTAGFNQHGFGDFQPGSALPTALQTLNGERPAKHGPVRVTFTPGTRMDYSGGGITVSQVLVEDVTGLTYVDAARRYVLDPIGMTRSTFVNPLPASHGNIARAHNGDGEPTALARGWEAMPEMAASGLWTSANDLGAFVATLINTARGDDDFLPEAIITDMMQRVPQSWHGLGPRLNGEGTNRVFHHGGANDSYRAWIEGHLDSGDGIVMLTNSRNGHQLYSEVRYAAEEAFEWQVHAATDFAAPEFR
ncbi:MAG: serine hydrolase domain-containing protein [Pseudomonadota bacterium]